MTDVWKELSCLGFSLDDNRQMTWLNQLRWFAFPSHSQPSFYPSATTPTPSLYSSDLLSPFWNPQPLLAWQLRRLIVALLCLWDDDDDDARVSSSFLLLLLSFLLDRLAGVVFDSCSCDLLLQLVSFLCSHPFNFRVSDDEIIQTNKSRFRKNMGFGW